MELILKKQRKLSLIFFFYARLHIPPETDYPSDIYRRIKNGGIGIDGITSTDGSHHN